MQLTVRTDYALRLLLYLLVHEQESVSVAQVAQAYGISAHHMAKVASELVHQGWVQSRRGQKGGLSLLPQARGLSMGDVVRALEHNMCLVECFSAQNTCPIAPACRLQGPLHEASQAFLAVLDRYRLEEVAQNRAQLRSLLGSAPGQGQT